METDFPYRQKRIFDVAPATFTFFLTRSVPPMTGLILDAARCWSQVTGIVFSQITEGKFYIEISYPVCPGWRPD